MRVYVKRTTPESMKDTTAKTLQVEYWKCELTRAQARRFDNGAMISCGLNVPEDITEEQFKLIRVKSIVEPTEYNHSGCLSRCVKRGDSICQW